MSYGLQDFCLNHMNILLTGFLLPASCFAPLESILHTKARVIFLKGNLDHVTLFWSQEIPKTQRIKEEFLIIIHMITAAQLSDLVFHFSPITLLISSTQPGHSAVSFTCQAFYSCCPLKSSSHSSSNSLPLPLIPMSLLYTGSNYCSLK